jgi:hypothetical protein
VSRVAGRAQGRGAAWSPCSSSAPTRERPGGLKLPACCCRPPLPPFPRPSSTIHRRHLRHCRCELRQAPAHSPPQKRALHLHRSSAEIPSCSSSSPRGQSTSGEAAVGVPALSHPRRRWRSPWPEHHRTTPSPLAFVPSSLARVVALVLRLPGSQSGRAGERPRTAARHGRAAVRHGRHT